MKGIIALACSVLLLVCGMNGAWAREAQEKQSMKRLNVLMIGNSFSESVLKYLPAIVKADGTVSLRLRQAYIGGCTIERHLREFDAALADHEHRPYTTNLMLKDAPKAGPRRWKANLPEMLSDGKWDIVTIQEGSPHCWHPEAYGADAERLIGIVRRYQPQAEIVVHQTWAYRCDAPRLKEWGFDRKEMHRRLTVRYDELAKRHGFRTIPTGDAVEFLRQSTPMPYRPPSAEELANLRWPDLPRAAGDPVGRSFWKKNAQTGRMELGTDYIHLNARGCYLQACVWYMFLFDKQAADVKFMPRNFDGEACRTMIQCAEKAVQNRRRQCEHPVAGQ